MGHYDNCREGYCPKCGAAPGNIKKGVCEICHPSRTKKLTLPKPIKTKKTLQESHDELACPLVSPEPDPKGVTRPTMKWIKDTIKKVES